MLEPLRIALIEHEEPRPRTQRTVVEPWAEKRGHLLKVYYVINNKIRFPRPESFDMLIVLGGRANVPETKDYPWLSNERRLIRDAIKVGKPVLGVCLGSQQLATELGGDVVKKDVRITQWHPAKLTLAGHQSGLFPRGMESIVGFHSHYYGLVLPKTAELLLHSKHGPQGFWIPELKAVGLLTHFEMPQSRIKTPTLPPSELLTRGQMTREQLNHVMGQPKVAARANRFFRGFLDRFVATFLPEHAAPMAP